MMRRLLVICHGFPPYYGGAEHAAGYLARAAAASGRWSVEVLTSDLGGRLPERETWEGLSILRVPTRKRAWARHTVPELLSFLHSASAARSYAPPDLIFAHFTLPAGEVARRMARRSGAPYAVVLQGSDVPGYQNSRFGLLYPVARPLVRRVWREASRVFAVSESLCDLARSMWPAGRIDTIPNGVDLDFFTPGPRPAAGTPKTLVVAAQLIERKGIQHLIAAVDGLPMPLRAEVRLRLCGTGPHQGVLERQVAAAGLQAQISFAGLVAHGQLPQEYRGAYAFVLPSLQEGLPLALLEAMASGLPVVATTVGGIPSVVQDGVQGLLVPPGNVPALARALEQVLSDETRAAAMGASARERVVAWSWPALWARYEALLP
jgi:glycogen(starch) synthase